MATNLRYVPKKQNLLTCLFSVSLFAAGLLILIILAPLAVSGAIPYLQIAAWFIIFAAFAFLFRFGMVSYEYYLADNIFYVVRVLFGRRYVVCNLAVRHILAVLTSAEQDARRQQGKPARYFNFTVSWPLDMTTLVYYRTGRDRKDMLILNYHKDFHRDFSSAVSAFLHSDTE